MTHAPLPVLIAADRLLALAPCLTWRWRFAIFLEVLRREVMARPPGDDFSSWMGL